MDKSPNKEAKKEAKQRVHTIEFHFYKILENANQSVVTKSRSVIPREKKEGGILKGHRKFWRVINRFVVLIVMISSWGQTFVKIYQMVHLKHVWFSGCYLYLHKAVKKKSVLVNS